MKDFNLRRDAKRKVIVACHRGVLGGNIPGNTVDAFEAALFQGADMLEMDVSKSADGVLYVFHPHMEPVHIGINELIANMPSERVNELVFRNPDTLPTRHHIMTLAQFFEQYKGRCYINVDKFWTAIPEITQAIREAGVVDQVLCKVPNEDKYFDLIEQYAPDIPFVVMVWEKDDVSQRLLERKLNYCGVEALFKEDDAPIASKEYMAWMHEHDLLTFVNAILYSYEVPLSGGHTDDVSVVGQPDLGWGWLADRGFDVIQTDWPCAFVKYLNDTGRMER